MTSSSEATLSQPPQIRQIPTWQFPQIKFHHNQTKNMTMSRIQPFSALDGFALDTADQENNDPASDSSAFESDCDYTPRPRLSNAALLDNVTT